MATFHLGTPTPDPLTGDSFTFALTQADVEEFRAILSEESGEVLDQSQVWRRATEVLGFFHYLLSRPDASGPSGLEPTTEA